MIYSNYTYKYSSDSLLVSSSSSSVGSVVEGGNSVVISLPFVRVIKSSVVEAGVVSNELFSNAFIIDPLTCFELR